MLRQALLLLQLGALATAWMPRDNNYFARDLQGQSSVVTDGKRTFAGKRQLMSTEIRGVNLGSLFIIEPWMASNAWNQIGCADQKSEFDCVNKLGQDKANAAFKQHWETWITEKDLDTMKSYGLNTIRIPVGYWINEDLVDKKSEHFPQGGLAYLDKIVGAASDRNMYIIMDLHGGPGAQVPQQPFTGQNAPSAGFFSDYHMQRGVKFCEWLANRVHTNNAYRGVGTIEVINEPINNAMLVNQYYPQALTAIRGAEAKLGITPDKGVHVMMMDKRWGSGDPLTATKNLLTNQAFDNHRYIKYDNSVAHNKQAYLKASCHDDVSGNWPLIVGEWSLSPADENTAEFNKDSNKDFYSKWYAAQIQAYEKQDGWVFWSWKTDLGDYRWDYQLAVQQGVIPKDISQAAKSNVCQGL